jgi:hypothetical protein
MTTMKLEAAFCRANLAKLSDDVFKPLVAAVLAGPVNEITRLVCEEAARRYGTAR